MSLITEAALARLLLNETGDRRIIVAIAGPPGVGKSTIAESLCTRINAAQAGICAILPMDGYHYDDIYLEKMQWRAQKGAPHTFDVSGFAHMLDRLAKNHELEIAVPVFDRSIEIARAGARLIPKSVKILLTEGNYLLLDKSPWNELGKYFDHTIMLTAPDETIRQRLKIRWEGFQYSSDEIDAKMMENDQPNVKTVISQSIEAEYEIITA